MRVRTSVAVCLAAVAAQSALPAGAQTAVLFAKGVRLECPSSAPGCSRGSPRFEPMVKADPVTGRAYVTDQFGGPTGGVPLFRRNAGSTRWEFATMADELPVRRGISLGGFDNDLALGSDGTLYSASLWAGSTTVAVFDPAGNPVHRSYLGAGVNSDRNWIAAHGTSRVHVSYWDLVSPLVRNIWSWWSADGGRTWWGPVSVLSAQNLGQNLESIGNLVVDPATGAVYTLFGLGVSAPKLFLARSTDGGRSFTNHLVYAYQAGPGLPGPRFGTLFPVLAVDRASNLYAAWSDRKDVWLSVSRDGGEHWSAPVRVSDPATSTTSVFPWVAAGSAGRVALAWIGSTRTAPEQEQGGDWFAYYAQSVNALDPSPTFARGRASDDPVHRQDICLRGLSCETGSPLLEEEPPGEELVERLLPEPLIEKAFANNRDLAEIVSVAVDVDGYALVAYPDDFEQGQERPTISVVAKQATGERLYAPGDYPNPAFEP